MGRQKKAPCIQRPTYFNLNFASKFSWLWKWMTSVKSFTGKMFSSSHSIYLLLYFGKWAENQVFTTAWTEHNWFNNLEINSHHGGFLIVLCSDRPELSLAILWLKHIWADTLIINFLSQRQTTIELKKQKEMLKVIIIMSILISFILDTNCCHMNHQATFQAVL